MEWFKAQASNPSGNCVEVSFGPGGSVHVHNSRDPEDSLLPFTWQEWDAFIAGAKAGEFDRPAPDDVVDATIHEADCTAGGCQGECGASEEMLAAEVALLAVLAGPGWHAWRGVAGPVTGRGLLYARRPGTSPAAVFSGRDPFTVAEKVAQWKAAREYRPPGR
jgi:hypothetical protein